jgi:hypothetical protein
MRKSAFCFLSGYGLWAKSKCGRIIFIPEVDNRDTYVINLQKELHACLLAIIFAGL